MDVNIDLFIYIIKVISTIIVVLISGILLHWYTIRYYWKKRGIKYEPTVPIFGNLQHIMRTSTFDWLYDLSKKYKSDYFGMFLVSTPVLVVQAPDIVNRIVVKHATNFQDRFMYSGYKDPLGSLNLFSVKNPLWSELRRDMTIMFTSSRLRMIAELMNVNAKELVDRIERKQDSSNKYINLKELFMMYTSDTVGFSVFGLRVSELSDKGSPLWEITKHMLVWNFRRGFEFSMIMFAPAIANILRCQFFSAAASSYIRRLFWSVVNHRKEAGLLDGHRDLVNLLLKIQEKTDSDSNVAESKITDDIMIAQVALFIMGSIETSSSVLCTAMYELAHHPDEQEKLYKEIKEAADKKENGDTLNYDDLLQLKYLTSCIMETLRKYPPLPYLDRQCIQDYKIDDNFTLEKGTPVFINVVAIHYNEEYYPQPKEWKPERFLGTAENDNKHFTFLPFGEGPRFCIGKRYGMLQVRAAIAQILLKYRIEPITSYRQLKGDPYSVLLFSKEPINVKFIARNH